MRLSFEKSENKTKILNLIGDKPELRTIMFLAGYCEDLVKDYGRPHDQLDGVVELMELANSYVLSDRIAIGGASTHRRGNISKHLYEHAHKFDVIELIIEDEDMDVLIDEGYTGWNILAFEDKSEMEPFTNFRDSVRKARRSKSYHTVFSEEERAEQEKVYSEAFNAVNTIRAKSYIFLSDVLGASYIPDRKFGQEAIKQYEEAIYKADHLQIHTDFRQKIAEQIGQISENKSIATSVPSFFLEALHNARNWNGVFASLEDMRNSKAAQHYRKLIHACRSKDSKQRREARIELERACKAAFTKEGFSGFLSRSYFAVTAFSAPAMAALFPSYGAYIGLTAGTITLLDQIGVWVRNRNNIFEFYNKAEDWDFYDELIRVFPCVKFKKEHLSYFLSEKNFGWSDDLVRSLYNIKKNLDHT